MVSAVLRASVPKKAATLVHLHNFDLYSTDTDTEDSIAADSRPNESQTNHRRIATAN